MGSCTSHALPKPQPNHKGFMGQTTAYNKDLISLMFSLWEKTKVRMRQNMFMVARKRYVEFYGGHDPEDYQHLLGILN